MINNPQSFNMQNQERAVEFAKTIVKAAKETHAMATKAFEKSRDAQKAIASQNKEQMWATLQKYILKYKDFIISGYRFTKIRLYRVDAAFYESITVSDLENQLHFIIGLVYAYEAVNCVAKEAFKQCLKKLLRSYGFIVDDRWELVL